MLKKAGIVVATATAGLLAVSPLAFAGDFGGESHKSKSSNHKRSKAECDQDNSADLDHRGRGGGLISVSDNAIQVPIQACNNSILNNVIVGILSSRQRNESRNGR